MQRLRALLVAASLFACTQSHVEPSLEVDASIASVTLADDCAAAEPRFDGDCATDGCNFCQQTGIQLSIASLAGDTTVPFEVVAIRLHQMDGTFIQELDPRGARLFDGESYVAWDESIAPDSTLSVTYDTSSPDWAAIGGGDPYTTYGMSFRIVMVVRVDGVERTIEFAPASREPEIVT